MKIDLHSWRNHLKMSEFALANQIIAKRNFGIPTVADLFSWFDIGENRWLWNRIL